MRGSHKFPFLPETHVWHWACATRATSARSVTPALGYQAASRLLKQRLGPTTPGHWVRGRDVQPVMWPRSTGPRRRCVSPSRPAICWAPPILRGLPVLPCRPSQEKVAIQCDFASHIVTGHCHWQDRNDRYDRCSGNNPCPLQQSDNRPRWEYRIIDLRAPINLPLPLYPAYAPKIFGARRPTSDKLTNTAVAEPFAELSVQYGRKSQRRRKPDVLKFSLLDMRSGNDR